MKGVSCIIRTLNERERLEQLLSTLRGQVTVGTPVEIVVVDSGSTDGTMDILARHGIVPISVTREAFNYSTALNLGISRSHHELIVVLSGHAVPAGNDWITRMTRHFEQENVAGVFARQIPWPGADLHEVIRLEKSFGEISMEFGPGADGSAIHFSNAASCIRRNVWEEHQFVVMPAAEDCEWARWAIGNGYRIVYDAEAVVRHSHAESCRRAARRIIEIERSADLARDSRRTMLLTARQSVGWLMRDAREISRIKAGVPEKLRSLGRTVRKCFWYAIDFDRV